MISGFYRIPRKPDLRKKMVNEYPFYKSAVNQHRKSNSRSSEKIIARPVQAFGAEKPTTSTARIEVARLSKPASLKVKVKLSLNGFN